MKKTILTIIMFLLLTGTMGKDIYAGKVEINETNFPDKMLRDEVLKNEWHRDGMLSKKEALDITNIKISLIQELNSDFETESVDMNKNYSIINCKGLEYCKNLNELYLAVSGIDAKRYKYKTRTIKNFNKVYRLKKIQKLTVLGDKSKKTWYFNRFPNLTTLTLGGGMNGKVRLGKKIKNIYIINSVEIDSRKKDSGYVGKNVLDLSKAKNLKRFCAEGFYTNVKFGKNRKLEKIEILNHSKRKNVKVKTLDFRELKNIKKISITGCSKLKKVSLNNNIKLKKIDICSKALKEIDVKDCTALKNITVYRNTKVKNLGKGYKISKSQKNITYYK